MADSINDVDITLTQIRDVLILIGVILGENGDEKLVAKKKLWELTQQQNIV